LRGPAEADLAVNEPKTEKTPWDAVDRLIDAMSVDQVVEHGLGPLAARRWHARGRQLPVQLAREERAAKASNLVAPTLLARIRDAVDGPLVLFKGPELSRRYPGRARRFGDLDLLPEDAEQAQAALLAAGFRLQDRDWPPAGYHAERRPHYHLHPLEWPGVALRVEIHKTVKWPDGVRPPSNESIFRDAMPAPGVDGLLVPDRAQHAVLLASHAWGEIAFRRLRQLVDIVAFLEDGIEANLLEEAAAAWGFRRGWLSSVEVCRWMFYGEEKPTSVRIWARHLETLRDPRVFEMHVQAWLAPFWMVAPPKAAQLAVAALTHDFRPEIGQTWGDKLRQTARALTHPFSSKSEHTKRSGARWWQKPRNGA
jgi:hypothetical protein